MCVRCRAHPWELRELRCRIIRHRHNNDLPVLGVDGQREHNEPKPDIPLLRLPDVARPVPGQVSSNTTSISLASPVGELRSVSPPSRAENPPSIVDALHHIQANPMLNSRGRDSVRRPLLPVVDAEHGAVMTSWRTDGSG